MTDLPHNAAEDTIFVCSPDGSGGYDMPISDYKEAIRYNEDLNIRSELSQKIAASTQGEWHTWQEDGYIGDRYITYIGADGGDALANADTAADAECIAALRNSTPYLLARIAELEQKINDTISHLTTERWDSPSFDPLVILTSRKG